MGTAVETSLSYFLHVQSMHVQCTNTVEGGDLKLIKIGSFVMNKDSDDFYHSVNMTLNASWPSEWCF